MTVSKSCWQFAESETIKTSSTYTATVMPMLNRYWAASDVTAQANAGANLKPSGNPVHCR